MFLNLDKLSSKWKLLKRNITSIQNIYSTVLREKFHGKGDIY